MLVEADLEVFALLLGKQAPPGLELPYPDWETDATLHLLRQLAAGILPHFSPAAWLIVHDRSVVGLASLKNVPDDSGAVEIGYGIAPIYRERGITRLAVADIVAWAKTVPRIRLLWAETSVVNTPSQYVLSKNGFTCTGERFDQEDGYVYRWELPIAADTSP